MRGGAGGLAADRAVASVDTDMDSTSSNKSIATMQRRGIITNFLLHLAGLQPVKHVEHELECVRLHTYSTERIVNFEDQPEAPAEQHCRCHSHQPMRTWRFGKEKHRERDG